MRPSTFCNPPTASTAAGVLLATLWVALAVPSGCSSTGADTDWERSVLSARSLQDRGAYAEAERRYRELLQGADTREEQRYVRLQLARLAADRGDHERALKRYRGIWSKELDDATGARAMFEAAELTEEELGEGAEARRMRRRLIGRYPASMWAERSVEVLAEDFARRDAWEAFEQEFRAMYRRARGTPVADDILFTTGETFEERGGDLDKALAYYRKTMRRHPEANFTDDAEWRAARILVDRQNWEPAVRILERLAERVKTSWFVGTYNSPLASKARFRLGMIHLTHLSEYREAIEHFRRYLADFPRNAKADDSAWHIAHAYRLMGDRSEYRKALRRLIEEFPESRYVERARRQLRGRR